MMVLALPAGPAHALLETCSVSTTAVGFGSYNVFSSSPTDSTGDIVVTCTGIVSLNVSYDILINQGSSGSFAQRTLISGSHTLSYNLYTDVARTTVWGDGTSGTSRVHDQYLLSILSETRHYPVYGRIPAQQNAYVGGYSDNLTVTVNY